MFDRPGDKLETTAIVLFWLGLIGSVVLAFTYGFTKEYDSYWRTWETNFNAVLFFTILICGFISSYISSLVLFGFGEAIEELDAIRVGIKDLKKVENTSSQNNTGSTTNTSRPQGSASTGSFNLNDFI